MRGREEEWRVGARHDLVGGIDRGPGSNQPVHDFHMAVARRHDQRSRAVLRCEAGHGRDAEGGMGMSRTLARTALLAERTPLYLLPERAIFATREELEIEEE